MHFLLTPFDRGRTAADLAAHAEVRRMAKDAGDGQNHGTTAAKPWENHGKNLVKPSKNLVKP